MKDPAFLFYSDNFLSGTMFFTDEQCGKYIRLLCAQHQTGHLQQKHMIFICKEYDKDIFDKFEQDENGLYYNERLEIEITKRRNYSESRSNNKKGKTKTENLSLSYDNHMGDGNEDEIINEIEKEIIKKECFNFKKSLIELGVDENIVSDWLKVRKLKKGSNTETAFNEIKKQIEKSGKTANDCIKIAVIKSWCGFESEWMKNVSTPQTQNKKAPLFEIIPNAE